MQLDEALAQIAEIRSQIDRTGTFRGYRAATVGFSGLVGVGAGVVQAIHVPHPQQQVFAYLMLWISAAAISVAVVGAELAYRCYRAASPRTARLTLLALEQFLPCIVAGALLTAALASASVESLWMLPGLWAILFSLGVFASCRLLPRPNFLAGVFFLAAGALCLAFGKGEHALSPWIMASTFGGGQLLTAALLYWTLERTDETH
ncbi:MAG: hypothetical protein KY475_05385 [Planctomycetes bacterium]|nr:hypothetical protein [Planctomycetota bacterium]